MYHFTPYWWGEVSTRKKYETVRSCTNFLFAFLPFFVLRRSPLYCICTNGYTIHSCWFHRFTKNSKRIQAIQNICPHRYITYIFLSMQKYKWNKTGKGTTKTPSPEHEGVLELDFWYEIECFKKDATQPYAQAMFNTYPASKSLAQCSYQFLFSFGIKFPFCYHSQ